MIKIEVYLYKQIFHWNSHVEALVTDLDSIPIRSFFINFPDFNVKNNHEFNINKKHEYTMLFGETGPNEPVTLYSNEDFDTFKINFYHKFADHDQYNYLFKNCADAVDYALDYFFPNKEILDEFYGLYQGVCCSVSLSTCGLTAFPTPPLITSPQDVFNKAKILSVIYKNKPAPDEKQHCASGKLICESIEWEPPKPVDKIADSNVLMLAVLNNENTVLDHFIKHHKNQLSDKMICYLFLCFLAFNQLKNAKLVLQRYPKLFNKNLGADDDDVYSYLPKEAGFVFYDTEIGDLLGAHLAWYSRQNHQFVKYICEFDNGFFFRTCKSSTILSVKIHGNYDFLENLDDVNFEYVLQNYGHLFDNDVIGKALSHFVDRGKYHSIRGLFAYRSDAFEIPTPNERSKPNPSKPALTSVELGRILREILKDGEYDLARQLLKIRHDICKETEPYLKKSLSFTSIFSLVGQDRRKTSIPGLQHLLLEAPGTDFDLFKMLCESTPGIDLSLQYKNKTALDLAIEHQLNQHVAYMIANHAAQFTKNELKRAYDYLGDVLHEPQCVIIHSKMPTDCMLHCG